MIRSRLGACARGTARVPPTASDGAQGAQGADGTPGTQGFQGAPGAQGAQGAQGRQGSIGSQGSGGGAQGAQGAMGVQGFQGAQGAQGAGFQGAQGAQGAQAGAGAQGFQGAPGAAGAAGGQGAQGFQGAIFPGIAADLTALGALSGYPTGTQVWVLDQNEFYQLDASNAFHVSSPLIVAAAGGGNWFRRNKAYVVGNFTLWVCSFGPPNRIYGFTPGQYAASNTQEPDILLNLDPALGSRSAFSVTIDLLGNLWVANFVAPHPTPPNGRSSKFLLKDCLASGSPTPALTLSANAAGPTDAIWIDNVFDRDNNLWVVDSSHGSSGVFNVLKYPKNSYGVSGAPVPDIQITSNIAFNDTAQSIFDSFGNLWSCSNFPLLGAGVIMLAASQLLASNPSLAPIVVWGGSNWSSLNISGMAFDSDGNLWVSDYATPALRCYEPRSPVSGNQAATRVITSASIPAGSLSALAFDSSGNLWTSCDAAPATSKVLMFSKATLATAGAKVADVVLQPPSVSAGGIYLNYVAFPNNPQRSGLQPSGWPISP